MIYFHVNVKRPAAEFEEDSEDDEDNRESMDDEEWDEVNNNRSTGGERRAGEETGNIMYVNKRRDYLKFKNKV